MKGNRDYLAVTLMAVTAFALVSLVAYVGGYFWLGQVTAAYKFEDTWVRRQFPNKGLATAYEPLAAVESWVTGWDVQAVEIIRYDE